jgi:hypothetical protein
VRGRRGGAVFHSEQELGQTVFGCSDIWPVTKYLLDFELLPEILDHSPWVYQLAEEKAKAIGLLEAVFQRVEGALFFAAKFHGEAHEWHKLALLRASFSEFASIEEVLPDDLQRAGISVPPFSIGRTANPLFHLLKQLRNYNMHIASSTVGETEPRKVRFGKHDPLDAKSTIEYDDTEPVVENLNLVEFNRLRESARYSEDDKQRMLEWFNNAQRKWGVNHLVYLAVNQYCDLLISRYGLGA